MSLYNPSARHAAPDAPRDDGDLADLVRTLYALFNRGDLEEFARYLAHDVVWIEAYATPKDGFRGPEAVRDQVLAHGRHTWEDATMTPDEVTVRGSRVIAHGTFTGCHRETRAEYRLPFFHTWTIRDGLVERFRHTNDPTLQERALRGDVIAF